MSQKAINKQNLLKVFEKNLNREEELKEKEDYILQYKRLIGNKTEKKKCVIFVKIAVIERFAIIGKEQANVLFAVNVPTV